MKVEETLRKIGSAVGAYFAGRRGTAPSLNPHDVLLSIASAVGLRTTAEDERRIIPVRYARSPFTRPMTKEEQVQYWTEKADALEEKVRKIAHKEKAAMAKDIAPAPIPASVSKDEVKGMIAKALLDDKKEKPIEEIVKNTEVVNEGMRLVLPEGMTSATAMEVLARHEAYQEEEVVIQRSYAVFMMDGAAALGRALERKFGWTHTKWTSYGFFGDVPPIIHDVNLGKGKTVKVIWGQFTIPAYPGAEVQTTVDHHGPRTKFQVSIKHKRKDEAVFASLLDMVGEEARTSIFRGSALQVKLTDNGKVLPVPHTEPMDLLGIDPSKLVLPRHVDDMVATNIFTPIDRLEELRFLGIRVKRTVLLDGSHGVGKTMTAYIAAQKAVDSKKWTFVYAQDPKEFEQAYRLALQLQPCVLFCEDIDRVANASGDEDEAGVAEEIERILNVIDGVESKGAEVVTVLTTNHATRISKGMVRPGRIDVLIEIPPADAAAAQRLVRQYGGELLDPNADLQEVGTALEGQIPATVNEVVEKSKLAALRRLKPGEPLVIGAEALLESAETVSRQIDRLKAQPKRRTKITDALETLARYFAGVGEDVSDGTMEAVREGEDTAA